VRLAERVMGGVLAATLVFVGLAGLVGAASATPRVPFSDPNAVGYIGLCNQAGRQITSGSIYTTPFAWRAVSSESAPPPYNNAWRTAILLAYQPRLGLTSGEWSGDALTASSRYSNPAHPMVAATGGDDSLEDFIQEFASVWDGYFELRIYLSTQNAQVYSLHYPALAIEVKGGSWRAVGGGQVNCRSGTSESLESIVLPKSATSPPTTAAPAGHGGSGGKATGLGSQKSATGAAGSSSSRSTAQLAAVVAALVIVVAASSLLIARRRRPAFHQPTAGITRGQDRKGP
jgi:hypothetical protein